MAKPKSPVWLRVQEKVMIVQESFLPTEWSNAMAQPVTEWATIPGAVGRCEACDHGKNQSLS